MTEPLLPPDPADPAELDPTDLAASVALDNESPDDQRDLPLDPASPVAIRVDQFRRISTAVAADIVTPESAVRDAHLAAALAAVSPDKALGESTRSSETVVALADRRDHPARRRWLAAAAAVAVVALAVPFANAIRHQSNTVQTSASSASPPSTASPVPAAGPIAPDAGGSSTTTGPGGPRTGPVDPTITSSVVISSPPLDLGSASSPQELAALVHTADPRLATPPNSLSSTQDGTVSSTIAPTAAATCDAAERTHYPGLGDLVLATTAQYRGTNVDVLVYAAPTTAGPSYRLLAVTPGDCTTVVDILL